MPPWWSRARNAYQDTHKETMYEVSDTAESIYPNMTHFNTFCAATGGLSAAGGKSRFEA